MEFMLLCTWPAGAELPGPDDMAAMQRFAGELRAEGKLRRGGPLRPEGTRVRVRDGRALVTDGPLVESKEVLCGFFVIDVADRDEALAIARRCPHARRGTVEAHAVHARYAFDDPGAGTPFLLAFRMEEGLCDPGGVKMETMIAFGEDLARQGILVETTPLTSDPPPARVTTRDGALLVTDGPFAEAKEAVGGYSLVRLADHADAVALATRYPHATWGPVEVREIRFLDPV